MLTPFVLLCTRWSVKRQLLLARRSRRELERYGPAGLAKLSAARGFGLYMLPFGLGSFVFAVAGLSMIAAPLFVLMLICFALDLWRLALAARLGRAWRTGDGDLPAK